MKAGVYKVWICLMMSWFLLSISWDSSLSFLSQCPCHLLVGFCITHTYNWSLMSSASPGSPNLTSINAVVSPRPHLAFSTTKEFRSRKRKKVMKSRAGFGRALLRKQTPHGAILSPWWSSCPPQHNFSYFTVFSALNNLYLFDLISVQ